ncbi:MAG: class I SAM-dependent methyltransferase [Acidobacteria bacterium]|nr:class I SAM-dependent methyltransferase [Acidobacteriota bacterium]
MAQRPAEACRVCHAAITPFMTFGRMPLANGFLTRDQIPSEYFFELAPACCARCGAFQLIEQPAPDRMFHDRYAFLSSSSRRMQAHFKAFADFVLRWVLPGPADPFVVELGSNDGSLLRHFKEAGCRHLGIEPSTNVAALARTQGLQTISEFFNDDLATRLRSEHGPADAVVAANTMCHIPDIHGVAAGISRLLAMDGVLIFEDPYLGDMVARTSYDQIYDEHVFMFSAASVACAFGQHGFDLIDVMPQATHGGSMRYVLARTGRYAMSPGVATLLETERRCGLHEPLTYDRFRRDCEASRSALRDLLNTLRREGKRVAGYGATSKSTTVINYCGIGPDDIEFIADTTPIKQGTLTPGAHIPVKPHEAFAAAPPDYALLFAWNHAEEIFEKEQAFKARGGRWITFVPDVRII